MQTSKPTITKEHADWMFADEGDGDGDGDGDGYGYGGEDFTRE